MPEVGNGFLATVVQSSTIYAGGLFNGDETGEQGWVSHRARIPPYTVNVTSQVVAGVRALDLERAVFLQRSTLASGVHIEERWYAPLHRPTILVHEMELMNPGNISARISIQGTVEDSSQDLDLLPVFLPGEDIYAAAGSNRVPERGIDRTGVALAANSFPSTVQLPAYENTTLFALTVVATSLNSTLPLEEVLGTLRSCMANGFVAARSLLRAHVDAWQARLESGRVEVEGDLALARAANASLYFLRSSIRADWPYGLSPGGLASNSYNGHTFWDQETWMWPPLLMLDPGCARSALQYRVDRIPAAAAEASYCGTSNHHECPAEMRARLSPGALMFPWESAFSGREVQYDKGEIGPWGRLEQHIGGDIVLAARQYWYSTRDREWLASCGFPLVNGIASFYAARLEERPGEAGSYDYNGVMGPDEYSWPVNNSAYVNAVVQLSLRFALEAAAELGRTEAAPEDFGAKAAGLSLPFSDTTPTRPDLQGGYHPEYAGFPKDPERPHVKQADTVLLSYPLEVDMSPRILANDLAFYDPITDPTGPAMTWSMFAIGWINVENFDRSQRHFQHGYANAQEPFNVWTETPTGGAVNFITGAGGFLQSLVFGTSGMRIRRDGLHFKPPPPAASGSEASRLTVHSFHYLGSRLRQEVSFAEVRYELLGTTTPNASRLVLAAQCQPVRPLEVGRPVTVQRVPVLIQPEGVKGNAGLNHSCSGLPGNSSGASWIWISAVLLVGVFVAVALRSARGYSSFLDDSSGGSGSDDESN